MIGKRGRDQATEEIARDIAGDVGGEGAGGIGSAALLAQVGERQVNPATAIPIVVALTAKPIAAGVT